MVPKKYEGRVSLAVGVLASLAFLYGVTNAIGFAYNENLLFGGPMHFYDGEPMTNEESSRYVLSSIVASIFAFGVATKGFIEYAKSRSAN